MPRWGTCHAEEHATLGSTLTGHHGSHIILTHCKCAAAFHHAANTPQLHLRKDSALTHNRFFCIDNTCRFWTLHLSSTTLPDHPQLERSAVHINIAAHAFAQRFKPHLDPNRTGSQAAPHHHPHTNTDRIGSQLHWIDRGTSWPITQALFPAHLQATFHGRIRNSPCQDGIQTFRGWCVSRRWENR